MSLQFEKTLINKWNYAKDLYYKFLLETHNTAYKPFNILMEREKIKHEKQKHKYIEFVVDNFNEQERKWLEKYKFGITKDEYDKQKLQETMAFLRSDYMKR